MLRGEDTKAYEAEFLGEFFKVNQAEAGQALAPSPSALSTTEITAARCAFLEAV